MVKQRFKGQLIYILYIIFQSPDTRKRSSREE
jgi:hypothetical protein